jgi:hypothetical protein
MLATKSKTPAEAPRRVDQFPAWVSAKERLDSLRADLATNRAELARGRAQLDQLDAEAAARALAAEDLDVAADRLLAGQAPAEATPDERPALRQRIAELERQIPVLERACQKQARLLEDTTREVSAAVVRGLQAEREEHLTRIIDAVIALGVALDRELGWRKALRANGVDPAAAGAGPPIPALSGQRSYLTDAGSPLSGWLRQLVPPGSALERKVQRARLELEKEFHDASKGDSDD